MKSLLARVGRNVAFPRTLPAHLGGARMLASTEGGLKFLRRDMAAVDPHLTGFAADYVRAGQTVWDIGANVGLFTFAAAGLAGPSGRVVAVEPDTWLVSVLRRGAGWNVGRTAPVDVLPVAVSDACGIAGFFIANQARACNALVGHGNSTTGGVRERQWVPTVTLDSLLGDFGKPDIVKIDVEHAEVEVLRGAEQLLHDVRPTLLVEVVEDTRDTATQIFVDADYRLIDGETGRPVERATFLTVAVPNA